MKWVEAGTQHPAAAPRANGLAAGQRLLDVVLAGVGLLCLAPVMLVVALVICIESGRPVLFSQARLGERGQIFRLYKFRKFRADRTGGSSFVTLQNDQRMTTVGRWLARTKLDELPQLWNVLAGDMSIVGPRPEVPDFADCFGDTYRAVLAFRPGIFGPNQVFLRNECSLYNPHRDPEEFYRGVLFPLKARADLAYFPHRTLVQDIAWVVRGVLAVFGWSSRRGPDLIDQVEAWIGQSRDRNAARDRHAQLTGPWKLISHGQKGRL